MNVNVKKDMKILFAYVGFSIIILLYSPPIFLFYYPLSLVILFYFRVKARIYVFSTVLIILFWYLAFSHYLSLLEIPNLVTNSTNPNVLNLKDSRTVVILFESSIEAFHPFRPLFLETIIWLNQLAVFFDISICIKFELSTNKFLSSKG